MQCPKLAKTLLCGLVLALATPLAMAGETGYTHKEIASLTGHKPSYSKSQLARGYAKLLGKFGGSYAEATVSPIRPACTS